LRRGLIAVISAMHAVISVIALISLIAVIVRRVRRTSLLMPVMIAVSALRNLHVALHRSVRRIAVSEISFRMPVRRLIVLIALRIISAELLIDLLKRFRILILRAARRIDAGVSLHRLIRSVGSGKVEIG
jgi:hypothetical protein